MGTQCLGKKRSGGSHSRWVGTRERGKVAAVIHSGCAQGERSGRAEQGGAIDEEERRKCMKQDNYRPVR